MNGKMKVVAITEERKVEILEVKKPIPGKGQILINVKACALCTWEQRTFTRVAPMPLPFIGGHEMAGVIEALGEDVDEKEYQIGQKVSVKALYSCGECYYCRQGKTNLCVKIGKSKEDPNKEIYGPGGLGQYLVAEAKDIYKLSNDIPFKYGALTEPVACVVNSIEQGKVELGNDVLVIGAGIMGLLHVMLSKMRGARVIVSEPSLERRKLAEAVGADITFSPIEEDFVQKVKSLTEERGADVVFNTTAIAEVAEQAIEVTGKLGRVVMYSSIHPDKPITISPQWLHNSQIVVTGAVSPSVYSFDVAATILSKGIINPEKLITAVYPMEEAQTAFEEAIKPDTYRIIVSNE